MPDFVITLPVVESAAFSVNPVATKGSTTITVAVKEITKTVYPEERYTFDLGIECRKPCMIIKVK